MTATDDYLIPTATPPARPEFETSMPVRLGYENNKSAVRAVFRMAGVGFVLAAPGLWIVPGSVYAPELQLMKLGVSVFFFLCGLALLMRNHVHALPEVYFDPIRRELRILQKNHRGRPETVLRRSYDSLGRAQITKSKIELWDVDGSVLMRLPLHDPDARQSLRMQLGALCA